MKLWPAIRGIDQPTGPRARADMPFSSPFHSLPFDRSNIAQALFDILAVIAAATLVVATGVGITAAFFILIFVRC